MARPREIQLEQGTISLQGFPKEVADSLAEHIKNFGKTVYKLDEVRELAEVATNVSLPTPSLDVLPHRAVGIYREGRVNRVVTVAYNLDTKQALVSDIKGAIDAKDASTLFKMAADKLRFV